MASTTPPDRPGPSFNFPEGARLPIPGNAELAIWILALVLALIVLAIIALAADTVGVASWVDVFKWFGSAYLLSRGIAKASRVLEQ